MVFPAPPPKDTRAHTRNYEEPKILVRAIDSHHRCAVPLPRRGRQKNGVFASKGSPLRELSVAQRLASDICIFRKISAYSEHLRFAYLSFYLYMHVFTRFAYAILNESCRNVLDFVVFHIFCVPVPTEILNKPETRIFTSASAQDGNSFRSGGSRWVFRKKIVDL